ncbi:MAG: hypothetical protein MJZ34_13360 [Paludibacteraceae bacterium]|nr:hypothetical protein [Paludibacteraceae bacterium]
MTIIMIEATAEELSANKTVMDTINEVLNKFSERLVGVNNIDYSEAFKTYCDKQEELEEEK